MGCFPIYEKVIRSGPQESLPEMVDMIRNTYGLKEYLTFNKIGSSFLYSCKMIASVKSYNIMEHMIRKDIKHSFVRIAA